jgi:HEAT repeat protein
MSFVDHESDVAQVPEDLPPVEPPSAGFIIQLFVVPGLIVLAIVGVWLLFGKLAGAEQDWKSLLVELQHPNEHRRWRGALGLAQMLKADQDRAGSQDRLSRNREIAQALSSVLVAEVKRAGQSDSDLKYQAFLARTLGLFDLPEIVLPALEQAMQSGNDRDVRKNALGSIAVMADRFATRGDSLKFPGLSESLLKESRDDDRLIRQLSAFTLGLFSNADAQSRLEQMLDDPDLDTRINAAVGLARHGNARGAAVFTEVLQTAAKPPEPGSDGEYEHYLALKNCIAAIERVAPGLDPRDRQEFARVLEPLLQPIAADFREPQIRISAKTALNALHDAH